MKTLPLPFRGVALGAAVMISLCTGAARPQAGAQELVPAPTAPGDTVIVVPPGAPPPVQVESVPVAPEPRKRQGFFDRLFGEDKKERQPARVEDTPDNDDDGDTKSRRAPKAEMVIEEAPPGVTVVPVPPQQQIQGQPAVKTEIRKEPAKKSTRRSNSSTKVEVAPAPPKTRLEVAPPDSSVITDRTTQIQKPPTIRELPAEGTVKRSVTATAPLPSDQAVLEKARAKTEMDRALAASRQPDVEVTQERTTVQPAPAPATASAETRTTTVEAAPPPSTTTTKVVEQQPALAETKEEIARLKDEVATVKEELKDAKSSSPPVNVDKVTIAAPNEAAPITPPEPADTAATPPARAASVAGSEAPSDRTVVKPSEPPAEPASSSSSPPASVGSDAVTVGTSAAKESGTPKSSAPADGLDSSEGIPTGTKTDSPNFVRSPFPPHNKLDITGMKPGSLAKDPSNGKVFRVP